jgi:hypothetical protein
MSSELPTQTQTELPAKKGFSVLALVSTLTGALAYLLVFIHSLLHMKIWVALVLAPISALAAIITGHRSHHQIKHSNGELSGIKLSRAGLILGYLYYALGIITLVLVILGASWAIKALGIN